MKRILSLILLIICLTGCKSASSKKTDVVVKKPKSSEVTVKYAYDTPTGKKKKTYKVAKKLDEKPITLQEKIIDYAKTFEGVKYRFGGDDYKGIDCSGLVFETFRAHDIYLPRISRDMAKQGDKIDLKDTRKGDLLFFKTGNRRNAINHVGIVTEIKDYNIYFIHSTTSKGVIISSLNEDYWLKSFFEARSLL